MTEFEWRKQRAELLIAFARASNEIGYLDCEKRCLDAAEEEIAAALKMEPFPKEAEKKPEPSALSELGLSVKTYNCLMRAGVFTVDDLISKYKIGGEFWLRSIKYIGNKCVDEIKFKLKELGCDIDQGRQDGQETAEKPAASAR